MSFNKNCLECSKPFVSAFSGAKFCSRGCSTKHNLSRYWIGRKRPKQTGKNNPRWNRGITLTVSEKGYFVLRHNSSRKSFHLHRMIAEYFLKRKLDKDEIVHHINGNKKDNRPENLYVCKDITDHARIHRESNNYNSNLPTVGTGNVTKMFV